MLMPVYLDGRWIDDPERAALPLDDPGVTQGAIVVETVRTFGRQPFRLDWHRPRLQKALAYFGMTELPGGVDFGALIGDLLSRLPDDDDVAAVVLVTPRPTLVCHARPLPLDRYRQWYAEGLTLAIPPTRHASSLPRGFKHRSRLHWWKADAEARAIDANAMAVLQDTDGVLTETAIGNLVAVRDGTLVLADPVRVVEGATLQAVRHIADRLGVECETADLRPDDLAACDELWISSTGCCLAPVKRVILDGEERDGEERDGEERDGDATFDAPPLWRRFADGWADAFGVDFRL